MIVDQWAINTRELKNRLKIFRNNNINYFIIITIIDIITFHIIITITVCIYYFHLNFLNQYFISLHT